MELGEMQVQFARARVARLASSGPAGPHVVPISFAVQDGLVYSAIDQKPKSGRPLRRLENIRAEPRVAVLVDHYEEDWNRLWWIRLDGRARIIDNDRQREAALRSLVAKYPQYRQDTPRGEVVEITPVRWTSWTGATPQP